MFLVVGLILGTRLWYEMWDAEKDSAAAFERRVDSFVREMTILKALDHPNVMKVCAVCVWSAL